MSDMVSVTAKGASLEIGFLAVCLATKGTKTGLRPVLAQNADDVFGDDWVREEDAPPSEKARRLMALGIDREWAHVMTQMSAAEFRKSILSEARARTAKDLEKFLSDLTGLLAYSKRF